MQNLSCVESYSNQGFRAQTEIFFVSSAFLGVLCVKTLSFAPHAKHLTQRAQRNPRTQRKSRCYFPWIRDRNSSRVLGLSLNDPSIALVTVCELSFSTPRMAMHRCRPSTTTPTPSGAIFC
jgi:hypothetical protein